MAVMRFEIVDSVHPEWRGNRFAKKSAALRELEHAVPRSRFFLRVLKTKCLECGDLVATETGFCDPCEDAAFRGEI